MPDSYLFDSPDLSRQWCPGCEPDRDPLTEILRTSWCWTHAPAVAGSEDGAVIQGSMIGIGEASGYECREMARLIR